MQTSLTATAAAGMYDAKPDPYMAKALGTSTNLFPPTQCLAAGVSSRHGVGGGLLGMEIPGVQKEGPGAELYIVA